MTLFSVGLVSSGDLSELKHDEEVQTQSLFSVVLLKLCSVNLGSLVPLHQRSLLVWDLARVSLQTNHTYCIFTLFINTTIF